MEATVREHQQALLVLLEEFDRICRTLKIPYVLFAGTLLGAARHQGFIPWDDDLDVLMLREDYERFLREADGVLYRERFYLQKEFSEHWPMFFSKLRLNGTTCLEACHMKDCNTHQGIYMDIFPCDHAAGTFPGRWIQFAASKVVIAKCLDRRGYDTASVAKKLFMGLCRLIPMKPALMLVKAGRPGGKWVHTFLAGARSYRKNVCPRIFFERTGELIFESRIYPVPEAYEKLLRLLYGDYMRLPTEAEKSIKRHGILVDTRNSWECYREHRDGMVFPDRTRSIR